MNKADRLAYMRKRFPVLENDRVDAVLSVSPDDIKDEMGLMDTFREYNRAKEKSLTSDETQSRLWT